MIGYLFIYYHAQHGADIAIMTNFYNFNIYKD